MSPTTLRIRELREARGWTQQELATESGVAQSRISEMEGGHTRRVGLDTLERLAAALGVPVGELFASGPAKRKRGR